MSKSPPPPFLPFFEAQRDAEQPVKEDDEWNGRRGRARTLPLLPVEQLASSPPPPLPKTDDDHVDPPSSKPVPERSIDIPQKGVRGLQKDAVEPHSLPKSFEAFPPPQRVWFFFFHRDQFVVAAALFNSFFLVSSCVENLVFKGPEHQAKNRSL